MTRLSWPSVPRRLPVPAWAIAIVVLWGVGLVALTTLAGDAASTPTLCTFRNVTGLPCPTCGSTRAVLAAWDGRLLEAMRMNPLMCVALTLGAIWLVVRLGLGRQLRLATDRRGRRLGWTAVTLLVIGNWAYLIVVS